MLVQRSSSDIHARLILPSCSAPHPNPSDLNSNENNIQSAFLDGQSRVRSNIDMRKSVTLVSAVAALTMGVTVSSADTLSKAKEAGVMKFCTGVMGLKPYIWQADGGQYTGIEVDVSEYVLKKLGIPKYEVVVMEWQALIPALHSGRCDYVSTPLGITQERLKTANIIFSEPFLIFYDYLIVKKDSPFQAPSDLKGHTIGSVLGTTDSLVAHDFVAKGNAKEVRDFNTYGEPFLALQNDQVSAVVVDQLTYVAQVETFPELRVIDIPLPYIPKPEWVEAEKDSPYVFGAAGFMFRTDDVELKTAFDAAIAEMDSDGTRQAIMEKYNSWSPQQANLRK
jgi:cystine transport system substrate-binding protein